MGNPPTLVAEYEQTWSATTSPKTVSVTVDAGDVLVHLSGASDAATTLAAPTGGTGLSWTLAQSYTTASYCSGYVHTTQAGSGQSFTLSQARAAGTYQWAFNALRFTSATGVGASNKSQSSSGAPSVSLTTTADNSAVVCFVLDWAPRDGASRVWRAVNGVTPTAANGYEKTYYYGSSTYTVYAAVYPDVGAAGAKTFGLTAPTSQKYVAFAVEVQGVSAQEATGFTSVSSETVGAVGLLPSGAVHQVTGAAVVTTGTSVADVTPRLAVTGFTPTASTASLDGGASTNSVWSTVPLLVVVDGKVRLITKYPAAGAAGVVSTVSGSAPRLITKYPVTGVVPAVVTGAGSFRLITVYQVTGSAPLVTGVPAPGAGVRSLTTQQLTGSCDVVTGVAGAPTLRVGGGAVQLPDGVIAVPAVSPPDRVFAGGRVTGFRFDVLDRDENQVGELGTVSGGSVDWVSRTAVHGGGTIDVTDLGANDVDWLNVRVRPVVLLRAVDDPPEAPWLEYPVGVFLPAAPVEQWTDTGRVWSVELLDKLSILDQDIPTDAVGDPVTFTAAEGANVVDVVRGLIEETGEPAGSVEPGDKTLPRALVWDTGTTRLRIINDLLAAASFRSLWVDGSGQFRVSPWVPAQDRPPVYDLLGPFVTGPGSLMAPDWVRDRDIYEIPNRYVAVTSGSGDTAAMVSVATNQDPNSKFSYQARGRWITRVLTNAEATSKADLDAIALRGLTATTSVTSVVTVRHPFLPELVMDSTVLLVNPDAGINGLGVVNKTSVVFDPVGLCQTELLEVATLTAEGSES